MSALSKVVCHEGDKTVLAFGNVFSILSFMQLMKATMTCLGRKCLGQVILHGTKKGRLINTSSSDINWNVHIFRVSVREHVPNPLFLYHCLFPLIEWKQT
jgi:hypothetical protein